MNDKEIIKTGIERDIDTQENIQFTQQNKSSDLLDALKTLHSPTNLESNTILTNRQVVKLTVMNWASQVYDIQFFKHFVSLFPKYRISGDDGRGRKEIIEIANAIRQEKLQEHERMMEALGRR